jgi:pilus assembly protein Flp/PilA
MTLFARFIADESGATSVEYGLIAVCISAAIVVVLQGVAGKLSDAFAYVEEDLK